MDKPRDIFLKALTRNSSSRPAAGTATSIVTMDLMKKTGISFPDAHLDPEKMAEVASTLPVPDAEVFDRLMAEVGQPPIRKEATARGVTEDEAEKLARTYTFLNQLPAPRNGVTTVEPSGVTGSRIIGAGV